MTQTKPPNAGAPDDGRIAVVFQSFLAYHHDRVAALGDCALPFAMAGSNLDYRSIQTLETARAPTTLFPGRVYEDLSLAERLWRTPRALAKLGARHYFLCNYNAPEMLLSAIYLRLMGRRVYVMAESRFADRPRRPLREMAKSLYMAPYHGALSGGPEQTSYLRFLGFRRRPIVEGYDTVALARIRRQAAARAPTLDADEDAFEGAFLFVGRMVAKKQPAFLIEAYADYVAQTRAAPRRLRMIGDGPELEICRRRVEALGLDTVDLLGARPSEIVARELSRARAFFAPSLYEEWGLVLNEALAFALPIVASQTMGGAAVLVEGLGNGFKLEPWNRRGWTEAMLRLGEDDALARRMRARAEAIAPLADTERFRDGVHELIARCGGS